MQRSERIINLNAISSLFYKCNDFVFVLDAVLDHFFDELGVVGIVELQELAQEVEMVEFHVFHVLGVQGNRFIDVLVQLVRQVHLWLDLLQSINHSLELYAEFPIDKIHGLEVRHWFEEVGEGFGVPLLNSVILFFGGKVVGKEWDQGQSHIAYIKGIRRIEATKHVHEVEANLRRLEVEVADASLFLEVLLYHVEPSLPASLSQAKRNSFVWFGHQFFVERQKFFFDGVALTVAKMALQQNVFELLLVGVGRWFLAFNKDVFVNQLFDNLLLATVDSREFGAQVE